MGEHAPLAFSAANEWGPGGCPGSPAMQRRYPDDSDSEPARQGTAAHEYLAAVLLDQPPPTVAANGYPIDQEMRDCAATLVADVVSTRAAAGPGSILMVEQRVSAARTIHTDNYGTPDVGLLDAANHTLHVWEYKYGHGYVDAYMNWQMINQAIAILEHHDYRHDAAYDDPKSWHKWRITLTVAQPRNYSPNGPLREWYLSGAQLRERADQLRAAAHEASAPDAELRTGPHCTYCSAAVHCAANQRARGNAVDVAYRQIPAEMTDAAMALEAVQNEAAIKRLEARNAALQEAILGRLRSGAAMTGWAIGHVQGRERWTVPVDTVLRVTDLLGVDIRAPVALVTPKQAVKLGIDRTVIAGYSDAPLGAQKLVAIDAGDASRAFGSS